MNNKGASLTPAQVTETLDALYDQAVNALRSAISDYIKDGTLPDKNLPLGLLKEKIFQEK